ncbi:hypothetical protein OAB01_03280 [Bacteroidia bacterium]|jgi:hypothetical protein|nr:hypothetical protein [Bacteroidia bacterium]
MEKKQFKKLITLILFLLFFVGGAIVMYTVFLKGNVSVDPTSVPHRTKQNPYYVDSLKKAGYYDTFQKR